MCQVLAPGIQVAKVDANGQLQLSLSLGCVSYTSWQPLHQSDPFPSRGPKRTKGSKAVIAFSVSFP